MWLGSESLKIGYLEARRLGSCEQTVSCRQAAPSRVIVRYVAVEGSRLAFSPVSFSRPHAAAIGAGWVGEGCCCPGGRRTYSNLESFCLVEGLRRGFHFRKATPAQPATRFHPFSSSNLASPPIPLPNRILLRAFPSIHPRRTTHPPIKYSTASELTYPLPCFCRLTQRPRPRAATHPLLFHSSANTPCLLTSSVTS